MRKEIKTLLYLIIGIVIYAAVVGTIGAVLLRGDVRFTLGVLWSSMGATIVALHLYFSLQKSMDLDESSAAKRESGQAMVRLLIMIVVVVLGMLLTKWLHPMGVIAGVLALKVSAYLQPFFIRQNQ